MEDIFPQLRLVSTVVLSILTYIWLDSYPPTYINVLSQVVVHLGMYAFFSFYFFLSQLLQKVNLLIMTSF